MQMMLSVVLAFALGALLGKLLLPVLYKLKFGQNIYELAPEAHKKKQGFQQRVSVQYVYVKMEATFFNVAIQQVYKVINLCGINCHDFFLLLFSCHPGAENRPPKKSMCSGRIT